MEAGANPRADCGGTAKSMLFEGSRMPWAAQAGRDWQASFKIRRRKLSMGIVGSGDLKG